MLSELFSILADELIKENVPFEPNMISESVNPDIVKMKKTFEPGDPVHSMVKDEFLDDYIGKVCSVDLTRWNDGVNNAYLISYDNSFIYYVIVEKQECRIGALGKKYIRQIETEDIKHIELPRNFQTQAINQEFFIAKKVNLCLDDRHFWSGFIGKDTEYPNLIVRKFDNEKIYVCQNVNEFALLICEISKIETIESK